MSRSFSTRARAARSRKQAEMREQGKNWYRIKNFTDRPNEAAIYLFDEIGYWGTTAMEFVQEVNALRADVLHIHINSPGGEVDDGLAIYNAIRTHRAHTITHVDGLAASAASFIALGSDEVLISPNGQLMIHDAMGIEFGNAAEMRAFAELLDRYSDNIASIYAKKSGMPDEECRALMRAETWFTGAEAVTVGLCDGLDGEEMEPEAEPDTEEKMAFARWDLSLFSFRYKGREAAPAPALTNHAEPAAQSEPEPVAPEAAAAPEVEVTVDPPAELVEPVVPDPVESAEDVTPADGAPVVPEPPGSVEAETGQPDVPVDTDAPADQPAATAADTAPDIAPVAAATDADPWAQLMSPLISATPAPSTWDDVFANLTKP